MHRYQVGYLLGKHGHAVCPRYLRVLRISICSRREMSLQTDACDIEGLSALTLSAFYCVRCSFLEGQGGRSFF